MVDMADRPDIAMRLVAVELFLGHVSLSVVVLGDAGYRKTPARSTGFALMYGKGIGFSSLGSPADAAKCVRPACLKSKERRPYGPTEQTHVGADTGIGYW
jgi:hypothetical protein